MIGADRALCGIGRHRGGLHGRMTGRRLGGGAVWRRRLWRGTQRRRVYFIVRAVGAVTAFEFHNTSPHAENMASTIGASSATAAPFLCAAQREWRRGGGGTATRQIPAPLARTRRRRTRVTTASFNISCRIGRADNVLVWRRRRQWWCPIEVEVEVAIEHTEFRAVATSDPRGRRQPAPPSLFVAGGSVGLAACRSSRRPG